MNAPQVIMICLFVFNFAINAVKHGEAKEGHSARYNIYIDIASTVIMTLLLWWGGFWGAGK